MKNLSGDNGSKYPDSYLMNAFRWHTFHCHFLNLNTIERVRETLSVYNVSFLPFLNDFFLFTFPNLTSMCELSRILHLFICSLILKVAIINTFIWTIWMWKGQSEGWTHIYITLCIPSALPSVLALFSTMFRFSGRQLYRFWFSP